MSEPTTPGRPLPLLLHEAEVLVERRRFSQARDAIRRGLSEYPDSADLQYLAAFIDYAEDRNDAALRAVEDVLARSPDHYGARKLRAHLLEDSKQAGEAELMWISLLGDYPEDADCYAGYAELTMRALDLQKAEKLAAEGLRHDPEHAGCMYVMAMASIARGSPASSNMDAMALTRLLAAHPENTRSSIALIVALADRGDNAAALRIAQGMLRARPDSPEVLEMVKTLRQQSHWSMLPLYPMQRWGWGGAIAMWGIGIGLVSQVAPRLPDAAGAVLTWTWIGYIIYSWVWPRLLTRIMG